MTKLENLLKEVKKLDEKATPSPWTLDIDWEHTSKETRENDQKLMIHYRTSCVQLAKACEVMVKALQYCKIDPGMLHPQNNAQHVAAYNALDKVEKIIEEEEK